MNSEAHIEANREFWRNCQDTHLASPEYYQLAESVLNKILETVPAGDMAIDLGCGDGQFTRLLAKKFKRVVGFDISPSLVALANQNYGSSQVQFQCRDIAKEPLTADMRADAVCCFGVFSCIANAQEFDALIASIARVLPKAGCLITRDSLSKQGRIEKHIGDSDYYACYRTREEYLSALEKNGFSRLADITLFDTDELRNSYFLFVKS